MYLLFNRFDIFRSLTGRVFAAKYSSIGVNGAVKSSVERVKRLKLTRPSLEGENTTREDMSKVDKYLVASDAIHGNLSSALSQVIIVIKMF